MAGAGLLWPTCNDRIGTKLCRAVALGLRAIGSEFQPDRIVGSRDFDNAMKHEMATTPTNELNCIGACRFEEACAFLIWDPVTKFCHMMKKSRFTQVFPKGDMHLHMRITNQKCYFEMDELQKQLNAGNDVSNEYGFSRSTHVVPVGGGYEIKFW
ncbi:unnamed protein product [Caenorhabditis sp. 36 PRJEB53466]|nr:unnamed protein product [Caenorhabditis sp. 36 PRJEB53466]